MTIVTTRIIVGDDHKITGTRLLYAYHEASEDLGTFL